MICCFRPFFTYKPNLSVVFGQWKCITLVVYVGRKIHKMVTATPDNQQNAGGAGPGLTTHVQPKAPFKVCIALTQSDVLFRVKKTAL